VAGSGIELTMIGNCQSLLFSGGADPSQFYVASRLFENHETEVLKIEMASEPDSLFSLGIGRLDFHRDDQCWMLGET